MRPFIFFLCFQIACTVLPLTGQAGTPSEPQELTAEDMENLTASERVWAENLDKVAKALSAKDFPLAQSRTETSLEAVEAMRQLLRDRGYDPQRAPRLDAMEKLAVAYVHISETIAILSKPTPAKKDAKEAMILFKETRALLHEAALIFDQTDAKSLGDECRSIDENLKKTVNMA